MEPVGGTQPHQGRRRACSPPPTRTCTSEIRAGRFREDLYFRLNVMPIFVPPLRERHEDIPLLAEHFMAEFAREYGRRAEALRRPRPLALLQHYAWPGNVRELRNVDRAPGDHGARRHDYRAGPGLSRRRAGTVGRAPAAGTARCAAARSARPVRARLILRTLAAQQGNMSRTAEVLGVERSNLYARCAPSASRRRGATPSSATRTSLRIEHAASAAEAGSRRCRAAAGPAPPPAPVRPARSRAPRRRRARPRAPPPRRPSADRACTR